MQDKKIDIEKLLEAKSEGIDKEIEKLFPRKMSGKWLDFALGKALYKYELQSRSGNFWTAEEKGGGRA